jgi:hypothetical protein
MEELDLELHKGQLADLYNVCCNLQTSIFFQTREGKRNLTTMINFIKKQKGFPF